MNTLNLLFLFLASYASVFVSGYFNTSRTILHTQIDLLPALMVYCGLTADISVVMAEAILAGCLFDSISVNPLGTTMLPLFATGLVVNQKKELLLRDQIFAQFILGAAASVAVPLISLLILLAGGAHPLTGWGTLWQFVVMGIAGGAFTPICFRLFDRLQRAFGYEVMPESSFRPDREIKRGRA